MKENSLHEAIQANWKELRGAVRQEWGKLTHDDVERLKGDFDLLAAMLVERYGYEKAEARKQIDLWAARMLAHQNEQKQGQPEQSQTSQS